MSDPIQVVGLGLATVDILVRTLKMPTWETGSRVDALGIDGGGPVGTAMVAVQKLGMNAGFVGTVGSDRLGKVKLELLAEHGLDVTRIVHRQAPENQVVLVYVHAQTGERIFSGVSGWGTEPLWVDELDRDYLTTANFLHLDGTHSEAALQAARWMHAAGKRVMLDGSSTRGPISSAMQALVQEADVLICGSGFGEALTGREDVWEIGESILDLGPDIVVQTRGETGSYTVTSSEEFHTPAFKVDVIDTTGSGDVFHGAYLVGLQNGWDLHTIALFSTAVAGMKCSQLGGRQGIPTFERVVDFLKEKGYALPGYE